MDEPELLAPEWERKHVMPALKDLYDELWVYGLPQFYDPLTGVEIPEVIRRKIVYTGYLKHQVPEALSVKSASVPNTPYILVTTGGGEDGDVLIDWVLTAYETEMKIPHPALILLGPFMHTELQESFLARIEKLESVSAITFSSHIEHLMEKAVGVVAMGGYNTFCEILSFDKPSIIVPRTKPRLEQYIRASRAQELGLLSMLNYDNEPDPKMMATALCQLTQQNLPSEIILPGLLDGLQNINRLVSQYIAKSYRQELPNIDQLIS